MSSTQPHSFSMMTASSIRIGLTMMGAAVNELLGIAGTTRGWQIVHGLLAVVFVVIGIIAFVHPGNTFAALAAVLSFYFVIKGTFDVAVALSSRDVELWWLTLLLGIVQILLGFWAAGDFGRKTILLIVWVGAAALIRGISQIITAFTIRSLGRAQA